MPTVYIDTETFSPTPIKDGLYRYGQDSEVMVVTHAFEDSPVCDWDRTVSTAEPRSLREAADDLSCLFVAHNAPFDRFHLKKIGFDIPIERWRCSMARALAHGLPGGLDLLSEIFNLSQDEAKMKAGKNLMRLFCTPRPKNMELRRATRKTHPAEWAQLIEYARRDITAMRILWRDKLPGWNYPNNAAELECWFLDQKINDRGIYVDRPLAEAAIRATDRAKLNLKDRTGDLTGHELASTTQRDATLAYILAEHGIDLPDMQKSTIERRLQDPNLSDELRELLAIRLQATTTSTAKYGALLRSVAADGRLHGTMQWRGASRTGRDAHRLWQPGNLPRASMKKAEIAVGIEALMHDCEDLLFDDVMKLSSNAIRGCIVAPPDSKLVISDLSNIEGRVAAWLAGETWKLKAFQAFDLGAAPDLYKVAYAKAFAVDADDVEGLQRQIGKVMELMLQYQGGVGAFLTGAATYGIDLEAMSQTARPSIPDDVWDEAEQFMRWLYKPVDERCRKRIEQGMAAEAANVLYRKEVFETRFGLSEEVFCVCDSLKRLWRRAHPRIETIWHELETAVRSAIGAPRMTFSVREHLKVQRDGNWLRIRLPSGRCLCYVMPQLNDKGEISYMGVNQYTRKWQRIKTYGGKVLENIVQATACDFFFNSMPAIEAAGYRIVLRIHDEYVTETTTGNIGELSQLMATLPSWAQGIPLAAAGFETLRYRKE